MTLTPEPLSIKAPVIFYPWTRMFTPGQCGLITFEPISKLATCTLAAGAGCNDFVQPSLNLGTNHRSCSSVIMIWNPIRSDRSALGSSLSWMSVACFAFSSTTHCCVLNRTVHTTWCLANTSCVLFHPGIFFALTLGCYLLYNRCYHIHLWF